MGDDRLLAQRLRDLAGRLATEDLVPDQRRALEDLLAAALDAFPDLPQPATRFARSFDPDGPTTVLDPGRGHPTHPLATGSSGVYPPLEFELDADGARLVAHVTFNPAWEGPPGLVHGGFLAAGFDMVLSALATHQLGHAVTRWLRLRYLKPTLLGQALRFEVIRGEAEGRLLDLSGTLYADDRVTMRAVAQFASVARHRFGDQPAPSGAGPI